MKTAKDGRPPKIELIDHAFFLKAQGDPDFRQALILDRETALASFKISETAEKQLDDILRILDEVTAGLADRTIKDAKLRQLLTSVDKRRVLLFAPEEAAPVFELSKTAKRQLDDLAETANIIAETLLGGNRMT